MLNILFWSLVGFFLGSIPFSVFLCRIIAKRDVRSVGDGNPGGTNAIKAGGAMVGIPVILLDIAKGFVPVFLAQKYGLAGWSLVPVSLAPILGHAFSPFLRFHGGKALGATGGVWLALVGPWAFAIYGALAGLVTILQSEDAWSANSGMLALIGYAMLYGQPWLVAFALLNSVLIAWTHHHDLARPPRLRLWVVNVFLRRQA